MALPSESQEFKAKLKPAKDIPLSPIDSLKRSVEYKQAI